MTRLIQLIDLSLCFAEKTCFNSFNTNIHYGDRIALIGDNGSGKSSLLKMICKQLPPSDGQVHYCSEFSIAYVPQLIDLHQTLSGAEKFNRELSNALATYPDILVLDEPTNHLDRKNRQSLMRLLKQFHGTLILASHDVALLKQSEYTFWHFHHQKIDVFDGQYEHLLQKITLEKQTLEEEITYLNRQKKLQHHALMQEQLRAKSARLKGEKSIRESKWPTIVSSAKARRAQETSGKKRKQISQQKEVLMQRIDELGYQEDIAPTFDLPPAHSTHKAIITIRDGIIAYDTQVILANIQLNVTKQSRMAILGPNGSGKSTLIQAIMGNPSIRKQGEWMTPPTEDIGYLDQHYQCLHPQETVYSTIQLCRPDWTTNDIRTHLNDFLFRKNEQVYSQTNQLSGGEKARLNLALIAAKPPKLIILDEVTNNLDIKTKNHIIKLLQEYPGPFIVISHDNDFLQSIGLNEIYELKT